MPLSLHSQGELALKQICLPAYRTRVDGELVSKPAQAHICPSAFRAHANSKQIYIWRLTFLRASLKLLESAISGGNLRQCHSEAGVLLNANHDLVQDWAGDSFYGSGPSHPADDQSTTLAAPLAQLKPERRR